MFDNDYYFRGKHATYVKLLTSYIDQNKKFQIFAKNVDVYAMAAVVGMVYNKRSEVDNGQDRTNILASAFRNNKRQIEYNYRMIMILHDKKIIDIDERIARAFMYDNKEEKRKTGDLIFDSYVLGGVEILLKKIFGSLDSENIVLDLDKCIKNLYSFLEEFYIRYDETFNSEIIDLCQLALD